MDRNNYWKYCVAGNIIINHFDNNIVRYGTSAFRGGTKVYLCGKIWSFEQGSIPVIGLTRGKRYQVIDVPVNQIINVRCQKVYKPSILKIMDDWEFSDCWWHNTKDDKEKAEEFVTKWKEHASAQSNQYER